MLDKIYNPIPQNGLFQPLLTLDKFIQEFPIDINPYFQRDIIWTDEQQSLLVGSILEGNVIPPCYYNINPKNVFNVVLVDGKQRVNACLRFLKNDIAAKTSKGVNITLSELNKTDISLCKTIIGLRFVELNLSTVDMLEFYIRLNSFGIAHKREDILKVQALIESEK